MEYHLRLPEELQTVAKIELNEIQDRVEEDVEHIRCWLLKQLHLIPRTDDNTLITFLRSSKFSLEKTKTKIELFYKAKFDYPELFKNRDPLLPQIQWILQNNIVTSLPNNINGPSLILVNAGNTNPDIVSVNDLLKISTLVLDVLIMEHINTTVVGYAVLLDFKDVPAKYLLQITPGVLKKTITCLAYAYPLRIKAIHYINLPPLWFTVYNILQTFFSKKLRERVFCHALGEESSIQQYFPAAVLPTEYGGEAGSFADLCGQFKSKVEKYRNWFLEDDQFGCVHKKNVDSSTFDIQSDGLNGSFRKLEID